MTLSGTPRLRQTAPIIWGTDMAFGALPPGQPGNWSIFDKDGAKALVFDTFFSCSIKSE